MANRKQQSAKFKSRVALEALRGDLTLAELASKYEIHPTLVTKWKKQAITGLTDVFSTNDRKARTNTNEAEIKKLQAKTGQLTVIKDFFYQSLRSLSHARFMASEPLRRSQGFKGSFDKKQQSSWWSRFSRSFGVTNLLVCRLIVSIWIG